VSRRHPTQQVLILPRKKHLQIGKETALHQSSVPARPATDDPGELQQFVENYLDLADKALGFIRRPGPNHQLTVSTCIHCQHTIAATNLKLLAFAENLHECPARQPLAPAHKNEAA
jgi:hypothetical protein